LNVWINDNVPQYYTNVDGLTYYVYKNGTVIDSDYQLVCKTGGVDCIGIEADYEPLVYDLYDGQYVIKLRLFPNGYVDTDDGTNTEICKTGGQECADQYINDNYPEDVVLKGDTYKLYLDGHSTDSKGTIICKEGGRPCLEEWVKDNVPTEVHYTIDGKDTTYLINDGTGKVTDGDGNVICKTGG